MIQPLQPIHPHREEGTALLVLGAVGLVGGVALANYCSVTFFGSCIDYPYQGTGYLVAGLGLLLLIVGLVLMVQTTQAVVMGPQGGYAIQPPVLLQPAPMFVQQAGPPFSAPRFCTFCGAGNLDNAAFCTGCGRPLPELS